ncbi:hypothetical protein KKA15_01025 [Patescibacteria group bacterium]|nr:hypothetical protein [Patescibacteria group bacterium]
MHKAKQNIIFGLLLVAIFISAGVVWYSPVIFKGYNLLSDGSNVIVKAKNYNQTGIYGSENDLNVIMSSSLIEQEGHESLQGGKINGYLHSYLIKFTGEQTNSKLILSNIVILALTLVLFAITVYYLFNLTITILFAAIYIFIPTIWLLPQSFAEYEFSLFFLVIFFLLFTIGTNKLSLNKKSEDTKIISYNTALLVFSGASLAMACLTKEALLIFLPILFLFLLVYKQWRYLLYIFIPVVLVVAIFWLPGFVAGENIYLLSFTKDAPEELKTSDFSYYAEFFPDPYTYHFNQEEYLNERTDLAQSVSSIRADGIKRAMKLVGFADVTLFERVKIGTGLFAKHSFRFLSIPEIGGPLIFILMALGLVYLYKYKKEWFYFDVLWIIATMFLLSFVILGGRNHLMDFGWVIASCAGLGIYILSKAISSTLFQNKYQNIILICLGLIVIYNLVVSSHVMWGLKYDNSPIPILDTYIEEIKNSNIADDQIIAVPFDHPDDAYYINLYTDKSLVVFKQATMQNLIEQNKVSDALEKFDVKYILGYTPDISARILDQAEVGIIADSTIEVNYEDYSLSNKGWFMNLVR